MRPLTYGTYAEVLYSMPVSGQPYANSTTRTLMSLAAAATAGAPFKLPAGYFAPGAGVGQAVRAELGGFLSNTGTPAFTLAAALDTTQGTYGTTLAATGAFTTASGLSGAEFTAWFDMTCQQVGTSGLLTVTGQLNIGPAGNAATTPAVTYMLGASAGVAINTTVDNFLEVWGTWGAASAINTATLTSLSVYGLN